jgi:hypothetical protein
MLAATAVDVFDVLGQTRAWIDTGRTVHPLPDAHAFHNARYPLFLELYQRTKDIIQMLAGNPSMD